MKPKAMKEFTIKYACGHAEKVLAKGWTIAAQKAESKKSCLACRGMK